MPQNKKFITPKLAPKFLNLFSKISTFGFGLILVLGLCLSFGPVATAESTTPAPAAAPRTTPRTPAPSTPSSSTAPSSGSQSGESIKPVDLCAGGGQNFIPGACFSGTEQYASGEGKTIITDLTTNIVSLLIFIAAAIAVFFIVLGGYKLITSNGDEKTAKEGKDMVFNSIIGLVVIILSFTIITVTTNIVTNLDIGGK